MAAGGLWAKIHKWLALLMALQILIWFASGLFFALSPLERVRSEHMKAEAPSAPVALEGAATGLARLGREGVSGERVQIQMLLGRQVALVTPRDGRPLLYDLATGRIASPISALAATRIAEADHAGDLRAARVVAVVQNDSEYRGSLPAWRVDFEDGEGRSIYVAADTGAVTARRSTLWRVYDFLYGIHLMDWRGHLNSNTWLLIVTTLLGLVVVASGIVLLPGRLGLTGWLRRRRRRISGR